MSDRLDEIRKRVEAFQHQSCDQRPAARQLRDDLRTVLAEVERLQSNVTHMSIENERFLKERDEARAEVEQRLEQWESLHTTYTHLCDRYSKLEAENTRLREEISEYIKATKKLAYSKMDTLEWKP